jgi:hypothetical protein
MHWKKMTETENLGAWDLADASGKPKDFTLEIAKVVPGVIKSLERPKGDKRPFIHFKGAKKPLVCNATNAKTITAIAGSGDVDKWVGLRVTLYATMVKAKGGEAVQGIRIRPLRASAPAEEMSEPEAPAHREPGDDDDHDPEAAE